MDDIRPFCGVGNDLLQSSPSTLRPEPTLKKSQLEGRLYSLLREFGNLPDRSAERQIDLRLRSEKLVMVVVGRNDEGNRAVWAFHPEHGSVTAAFTGRRGRSSAPSSISVVERRAK